jgi:flagellar basal-body rod modification protein FlgD
MAAATGIWTQHPAAALSLSAAQPAPLTGPASGGGGGGGSGSSSGDSATISANDFLTLLVTEMQNQDPTDDTDPNQYIDQLVQVNSLEQLIDINQNLSTALGISTSGTTDSSASPQISGAAAGVTPSTASGAPAVVHPAAHKSSALGQVQSAAANAATASQAAVHGNAGVRAAPGNLSIPNAKAAAHRVAEALGGRGHPQ